MVDEKVSSHKGWLIVIGLGLALIPIHNEFLTNLTSIGGQVILFLPTFGYVLLFIGTFLFILRNWEQVKALGLGDRRVWIPLLVIVAGIALSGFVYGVSIREKVAPLFMGVSLFAVYVVAKVLGEKIFSVLVPFVIIGSLSVIVSGLISLGQYTGGFITNYCASAGYLIFGALVYRGKWRWLVMLIAGIGLFFIGALEAVFIIGVLGLVLLARRDFNRKLLYGGIGLLVLVGVWAGLGYLVPLYEGNDNLLVFHNLMQGQLPLDAVSMTALTSGRWSVIRNAVRDFSFVGHGYSLSTVGGGIVHNMPLIVMHQIGPLAALAWLFASIYCLGKTGWRYIWVVVLAMGVFDHYLWTQMAPWWWALVGVSTVSSLKSDLIFKSCDVTTKC